MEKDISIGQFTGKGGPEEFFIEGGKHIIIVGGTGTGKSTLMERLAVENIRNGDGVIVVDPHGPLAEGVADHVPKSMIERVIWVHAGDEKSIGMNVFDFPNRDRARNVFEVLIKRVFGENSWLAESSNIFVNSLNILWDVFNKVVPGHFFRFITDTKWRKKIVAKSKDRFAAQYFTTQFDGEWDKRMRTEKSAPFLNKISTFLTDSRMRPMMNQPDSLDFRKVMDKSQVLLINLDMGQLGEGLGQFLGGVAVHKASVAALSRGDIPKKHRKNVYIYIDEFPAIADTLDLSTFLQQSRKYNVFVIFGTQAVASMDKKLLEAVLGCCGTKIVYNVSADDAAVFEKVFAQKIPASAILELVDFECYVQTKKNHVPIGPFKIRAHPPVEKQGDEADRQAIIRQSEDNHGRPKKFIEDYLNALFDE